MTMNFTGHKELKAAKDRMCGFLRQHENLDLRKIVKACGLKYGEVFGRGMARHIRRFRSIDPRCGFAEIQVNRHRLTRGQHTMEQDCMDAVDDIKLYVPVLGEGYDNDDSGAGPFKYCSVANWGIVAHNIREYDAEGEEAPGYLFLRGEFTELDSAERSNAEEDYLEGGASDLPKEILRVWDAADRREIETHA